MSIVKVNLKEKMLDHTGKEIKLIDRTSISVPGTGSMSVSIPDINNAKPMRLGDAILEIFARKLSPKNFEDAADMKKWHSKIYNKFIVNKGIIELDSDELKEFKEILDTKADPTKLEVIVDGEVYRIITDYLQKALINKK